MKLFYIFSSYEDMKWDEAKALFSSHQNPKSFQDSPSHRILRYMHESLNIDKN